MKGKCERVVETYYSAQADWNVHLLGLSLLKKIKFERIWNDTQFIRMNFPGVQESRFIEKHPFSALFTVAHFRICHHPACENNWINLALYRTLILIFLILLIWDISNSVILENTYCCNIGLGY